MNLSKRVENLENKSTPGKSFTVIKLKIDETNEQALKRHCAENGIDAERLEHPESLTVLLRMGLGE